ncbi:MAG TPA: hypothetical protein VFM19_10930 [Candidatus Limnocylindria bacterium]|nr:hypothetical protein [Candidatus Limnocylindria bacterium]
MASISARRMAIEARLSKRQGASQQEGRVSQSSFSRVGRTVAMAACLALAACSTDAGSSSSLPTTAPSDSPSGTAPHPSTDLATVAPSVTTPPSTPAAAVPKKPTGVTFATDVVELRGPPGTDELTYEVTHTVRWESPRADGIEIRVYGVTACLSEPIDPPAGTSGPCLVERTRLPSEVMSLTGTAPSDAGKFSWIAAHYYECGGGPVGPDGTDYEAIVLAAYNAHGNSIFAIAYEGSWFRAAPDVVIC